MRAGGESPAPRKDVARTRRRAAPWEGPAGWRPIRSPSLSNSAHLHHKSFFKEAAFPSVPSSVNPGERTWHYETGTQGHRGHSTHSSAPTRRPEDSATCWAPPPSCPLTLWVFIPRPLGGQELQEGGGGGL